MSNSMRGVYTSLAQIRRTVFREVARLAYESQSGDYGWVDELPVRDYSGRRRDVPRACFSGAPSWASAFAVMEACRCRAWTSPQKHPRGVAEAAKPETYYQPPLINVIKFACNACEENSYKVSDACQGCLAHPCREICPKGAITFKDKKAYIDQEKCIKCGRCANVCPYGAIQHHERPCAVACGMNAISSDEKGRAQIDYSKCVSCGQCFGQLPFGAIADKSQIFQFIQAILAVGRLSPVAPAFVGPVWRQRATWTSCARPLRPWASPVWRRSPWAPICARCRRPRTSWRKCPTRFRLWARLYRRGQSWQR